MALNLNNHLLQAEDGLVSALLWYLVLQVVLGSIPSFFGLVFVLIGDVGRGSVQEVSLGSTCTCLGIHAGISTLLSGVGFKSSSVSRVARS